MQYFILVYVLFHVNVIVTAITNKINVTFCENEIRRITCEPNNTIHILDANYGRTSSSVCPYKDIKTVLCKQENTVDILIELCDDEPECIIHASNAVFGDPCPNTMKYLHVLYECVPKTDHKHARACENEQIHLNCDSNKVIEISRANYGRTNGYICTNTHVNTTNCVSRTSKSIASAMCNNKNSCTISASNSIFGDPCYGTQKYLTIKYKCVRRHKVPNKCDDGTILSPSMICNGINDCYWGEDESVCLTKTACEHKTLILECEPSFQINVMYAIYGRTYISICPTKTAQDNIDYSCNAINSVKIVKESCNGRRSCQVPASNAVFGDPCSGIEKYLRVKYTCEPDDEMNEIFPR